MKTTFLSILCFSLVIFYSCTSNKSSNAHHQISFDHYVIEEGFELQLVASEPLINAPVAIDFDNTGRIWVVEMRGYMPDLSGNGEEKPTGRISILDDIDENGVARRSRIFLDSLVLPRALAHVYGGLLYAEPPNLWFVEINNDKPGKKTLVDSMYADGGYVEMQPNGLMMNIDNWIYSANSTSRYQMRNGTWFREPTALRGQWGISKDNYGRLYYNYNEVQLAGDHVLPNALMNNRYFIPKESENKILTDNQRVYPIHPTTVNRGYAEGILTPDSLLKNFTAACGPVVYRGNQFPEQYSQNVFVCEPQANIVKRNILSFDSIETTAAQAWNDREFLASRDEGFRPVNLLNAPDGSMYVVDMHRGVLEHRAVSSPYYRNEIAAKKLDTLLSGGRILRIKSKNKTLAPFPEFAHATPAQLVHLLQSENGWVRDRAQQLLVERQPKVIIPALQALIDSSLNAIAAIHALHTLHGMNALTFEVVKRAATADDPMLRAHALLLSEQYASEERTPGMLDLINKLIEKNNAETDLYVAVCLGAWNKSSPGLFMPVLEKLSAKYANRIIFQEAVTSSLNGHEEKFRHDVPGKPIQLLLAQVIKNKKEDKVNPIFVERKLPLDERANGRVLFRKTCTGCHGGDGEGVEHAGPPLRESQYVQGSLDRLALIILNGLEGPIHINNREYRFNGTMPAFGNNLNENEIADIIGYLRNSYVTHSRTSIEASRISELRKKVAGTLTEEKVKELGDR